MKHSISMAFCLILIVSFFSFPAKASTYASVYLQDYDATLSTGSRSGQLALTFYVDSFDYMNSLGISSIAVYTSDNTYVKTINGSTSNGLLAANTFSHGETYTVTHLTPGQEYYLRLTFVARDSYSGDSKIFTTNTAMAAR